MAKWNSIVITNAGMALSAETLSGKQIQYTHAQTTDTNLSDMTNDEIKSMTGFDSVVQDLNIGTVTVADDHTVQVPVQLSNEDVTEDYQLYGLAIFAKPVDGAEILYGVAVATVPDTIEAKGGTTVTGTDFNLKIHVSDSSNVQITVVQTAGVTNEQLDITLKSYTLESDLTDKLAKYTSTVVHTADMRKPASDVAGIEEVNAKQDKIGYTPADDSKVAHLSGANNFDTVPTVKNNPLLLASSLPSYLANYIGIDSNTSQVTNHTVKFNDGQLFVNTQPVLTYAGTADPDEATAKTKSSDGLLHYTIES